MKTSDGAPSSSTPAPIALEVQRLGVRAGSRSIVRDVSFETRAGEITAVIGPNGAGKSTLLEAIAGLRPASGKVRFNGRDLRTFADFARVFSFLPDAGTLPPEATVGTLVDHASALASRHLASRDLAVRALRQGLALEPLLSQPVGVLSRGEHQRLALFCVLALGRPIAVLDEPFSAFDPLQLRKILAMVREVVGSSTSMVASFHQLADAASVADRIVILADGRMFAFGDLASLRVGVHNATASLEDVFVSLLEETPRAP